MPERTSLVMLPGLAGDHREFQAQTAHFERHRNVVALDPLVEGDLSVEGQAAQVAALAAERGLGRFVLLGHSQAGMVALALALQQPRLLAGIIVLDSPVLLPAAVRGGLRLPLAMLSTPLAKPLLRVFFRATFTDADTADWRAEVLDRLADVPVEVAVAVVRGTFGYDSTAALEALSLPALVVRANIPVRLDQLPARVGRAEVLGVGHWAHVHAPSQVNAIVEGFLADIDGSALAPEAHGVTASGGR